MGLNAPFMPRKSLDIRRAKRPFERIPLLLSRAERLLTIAVQLALSHRNIHRKMAASDNGDKLKDLEQQMEQNMEQRTSLSSLLNKGYLDRPVYLKSLNSLVQDYDNLATQRDMLLRVDSESFEMLSKVQELIDFLRKNKNITEYSEELFDGHVDTIKVISREEIQFSLRCGLILTERL